MLTELFRSLTSDCVICSVCQSEQEKFRPGMMIQVQPRMKDNKPLTSTVEQGIDRFLSKKIAEVHCDKCRRQTTMER